MAPMLFTRAILAGEPIRVFNNGKMRRDFTYVDDIVEGIARVIEKPPSGDRVDAPYAVYNIGNHEAVELEAFMKQDPPRSRPVEPPAIACFTRSLTRLRSPTMKSCDS